jgi:excisionase family DNA binding protein
MSDELSTLDRPLTLEEAAEYLQLPSRTVRELCARKRLAHARLSYRNFRFRRADLDAYVDKRTVKISWLK